MDYDQDTSCNVSEIVLMADGRRMRKHQKRDMALKFTQYKDSDQQTRCKRNLYNVPLMTRHIELLDRDIQRANIQCLQKNAIKMPTLMRQALRSSSSFPEICSQPCCRIIVGVASFRRDQISDQG